MKTILLLLALLITQFLSAQSTDTTSVGEELIKFEKQYSNGKTLAVFGTAIAVTGALIAIPPVSVAGLCVALIGEVYSWDSHKHIRRAGKILNQIDNRKFILNE